MKALIFGASGQDGRLLTALLKENKIAVLGVSRSSGDLTGDVADYPFVGSLIRDQKPQYIFHFAATSTTHHGALFENHQAISTGTLNILESVRLHCPDAKVFLSGSAMQFSNDGNAIDELTPFEGSSPYSVARIHSIYAGRYYRRKFGLAVYCGYLFNHDSPIRTEQHVNQKIVRAVQRIGSGRNEVLELGDISVKKEFNYAGDVIEAIWLLVNQTATFEAVIGSGEVHSIAEWVEYCFRSINREWKDCVQVNSAYKAEYGILVSKPLLLRSLGWRPKVGFSQLADMMLADNDRSL